MENNPLHIIKEIINNYNTKKDLTSLERAFMNAVNKREEVKVQLDEYDEKIKFFGELDRAGDYLYVSYSSWTALPFSVQAIFLARLDIWKWNGINIQYSKFLEIDEELLRITNDNCVVYLCEVANHKELVVFSDAIALKMNISQFNKLKEKFAVDYKILKSYSMKTEGLKRHLVSLEHKDFNKLKELEKYI